jgi:hypothetical protein
MVNGKGPQLKLPSKFGDGLGQMVYGFYNQVAFL